jgi:hypothetical protein
MISDFVIFRSTLDADLSCGKENRELYGDFWNPSKFSGCVIIPFSLNLASFENNTG